MARTRETALSHRIINRRRLLGAAAGTTALAVTGSAALAACSGNTTAGPTGENNSRVRLPDYVPYKGTVADLASTEDGVLAGYLKHPADPESIYPDKPFPGGNVTALVQSTGVFPPPLERNPYWQALNDRLGASLQLTMASAADFPNKRAAVLAGGDLPDFVEITPMPELPRLLEAEFENLSEHLSGDAINDYRSLANIPTQSWRNAVYNGGIYGIPIHRGVAGTAMLVRDDVRQKRGLDQEITSGADFLELCRALTDARNNKWATTSPLSVLLFFQEMLGAPNVWRNDGGKFTHTYETDETKKAIELVTGMWKEGLFYPDSFASPRRPIELIGTGTVSLINYGYSTWHAILLDYLPGNPQLNIGAIPPPKHDGGGLARKFLDSGIFSITAIKKSDPARVKNLLKLADWLAAPFGTEENLFKEYGLPGRDYSLQGSDPVPTSTGKTEVRVPVSLISNRSLVLYEPGVPDAVRKQHKYQETIIPTGQPYPTVGLYSDTHIRKGATLEKSMQDLIADLIQGRKPLSSWDEGVADWRKNGGDAMRTEYERALQDASE